MPAVRRSTSTAKPILRTALQFTEVSQDIVTVVPGTAAVLGYSFENAPFLSRCFSKEPRQQLTRRLFSSDALCETEILLSWRFIYISPLWWCPWHWSFPSGFHTANYQYITPVGEKKTEEARDSVQNWYFSSKQLVWWLYSVSQQFSGSTFWIWRLEQSRVWFSGCWKANI